MEEEIDRELKIEAERQKKRRKFDAQGLHVHHCTACPQDDPLCLEVEHVAGRLHDYTVILLCANCHRKRTADQRCDPSPGPNPLNVFEVIGRWLLSVASYFELLKDTLRRFGLFLIDLAAQGYGDEFAFE